MFSWYLVLKFIHIFAAVIAVGANITYGVWNARSESEPAHLGFALKGIKFIDDRIANPAYGVVLLTGVIMIFAGNWGFKLWIIIALILFAIMAGLAVGVYSPLLRKMIQAVDAGSAASAEVAGMLRQNRILGPVFGLIVALILVMMVFKPSL